VFNRFASTRRSAVSDADEIAARQSRSRKRQRGASAKHHAPTAPSATGKRRAKGAGADVSDLLEIAERRNCFSIILRDFAAGDCRYKRSKDNRRQNTRSGQPRFLGRRRIPGRTIHFSFARQRPYSYLYRRDIFSVPRDRKSGIQTAEWFKEARAARPLQDNLPRCRGVPH